MTRHLLFVGAQRCATTYLHDLLAAHPEIAMARPARPEPKVFLSDEMTDRGLVWYRSTFFAHATDERILGDKSTSYLEYAETASRAARMLDDPLILVLLRDPIRRAVSHWAFSRSAGLETRGLSTVLTENLKGPIAWDPELSSVSPFAYLERGRYIDYLPAWLRRFGDDVTIVFLEDLLADPHRVGDVYAALGIDRTVRPSCLGFRVNESSQAAADIEPELYAQVRDYFRRSDAALADLLGRDLPWPDPLTTASRA